MLQLFQDVFSLLPVATVIDGKILIVHGGISDQTDLDFLSSIERQKVRRRKSSPLLFFKHFTLFFNSAGGKKT